MKISKLALIAIFATIGLSSCKRESLDERILNDVKNFSEKSCPQKMDDFTTMDSITYDIPTTTLTYHYTVTGDLDVDSIYTDELKEIFRQKLLENVKTSLQLKAYKEHHMTFCYQYQSAKSGKELVNYVFTEKDYQ